MPHLIANRPRQYDLVNKDADLADHFRWETISAIIYVVGGIGFIAGSLFFFPRFVAYADLGAWIFFFGSLLYLIVNLHDLAEVKAHWRSKDKHTISDIMEAISVGAYLPGTLLFIAGSIFFLSEVDWIAAGAWCFIIGSLLYLCGACINVLQIVQERSLMTLQLMNLTAMSFITGSLLFAVASAPYLWTIRSAIDRNELFTFLAWQFVIGSVLFLLGGVFNYWRAYLVMRSEMSALPHRVS